MPNIDLKNVMYTLHSSIHPSPGILPQKEVQGDIFNDHCQRQQPGQKPLHALLGTESSHIWPSGWFKPATSYPNWAPLHKLVYVLDSPWNRTQDPWIRASDLTIRSQRRKYLIILSICFCIPIMAMQIRLHTYIPFSKSLW